MKKTISLFLLVLLLAAVVLVSWLRYSQSAEQPSENKDRETELVVPDYTPVASSSAQTDSSPTPTATNAVVISPAVATPGTLPSPTPTPNSPTATPQPTPNYSTVTEEELEEQYGGESEQVDDYVVEVHEDEIFELG